MLKNSSEKQNFIPKKKRKGFFRAKSALEMKAAKFCFDFFFAYFSVGNFICQIRGLISYKKLKNPNKFRLCVFRAVLDEIWVYASLGHFIKKKKC
jgi:hypothetical protein